MKKAYFAGGCFWCITPMFKVYGADNVVCGYSGGDEVNPTYEDVKKQKTGHRETICVEYEPSKVSYDTLLEIFLANIDPNDGEGQYIDRGYSYTTAIYYNDEIEKNAAVEALKSLESENGMVPKVALEQFKTFYAAEEYHQDYYLKNPEAFEKELKESGRKRD